MPKKALVRALTELDFSTLALKIKALPKGTVPKADTPSETLGLLSEILDEDFSEAVACLVSQEKLNAIHKDAPASEIYEHNSKNPRPEVLGALLSVDKAAKENRTTLAVALKEAGMTDLADALPVRLYTVCTTPSDILFAGFVWSQTEEGQAAWGKAFDTIRNIEKQNADILKDLQKIDPTLKNLNYCKPDTSSKLALYKSKVSIPHADVLTKLETSASVKARAVKDLYALKLSEAAEHIEKMELDLPEYAFTSDVIDSFIWRNHAAGYAFWREVHEKVLQAEKITSTNKENLIKLTKELGHHDKAEALQDIWFSLQDSIKRADQTLMAGFGWHSSPQGGAYWNSLHKELMQAELIRQEKEKEMSMSTNQKTLIDVLKKLGELEAAAHIAKMDGSIFEHDTPKGMLEFDFRWHETPQGYMFWLGVDARVKGLDKSAEWHDACKARKANLIQACFDAGRKDAAKLVKALPYELFHTGETPVEVAQHICEYKLDKETQTFWEGLLLTFSRSFRTAERAAKKRLIDAVYEVTGKTFETLAELPLSAFSGLTVPTAENLVRAFDWYESEEGEDFWQGVHGKLEARQTVTVTVTVWRDAERSHTSQEAQKALVEACIQAGEPGAAERIRRMNIIFCLGNTPAVTLKNSFNWEKTEPGYDFWRRVSEALQTPKEIKTETPHIINMHDTYKTRDGRDVRVLCVDVLDDTYKVIALVKTADGTTECMEEYTATGAFYEDEQGDDDLVLHSTKDPRDSLKIED